LIHVTRKNFISFFFCIKVVRVGFLQNFFLKLFLSLPAFNLFSFTSIFHSIYEYTSLQNPVCIITSICCLNIRGRESKGSRQKVSFRVYLKSALLLSPNSTNWRSELSLGKGEKILTRARLPCKDQNSNYTPRIWIKCCKFALALNFSDLISYFVAISTFVIIMF